MVLSFEGAAEHAFNATDLNLTSEIFSMLENRFLASGYNWPTTKPAGNGTGKICILSIDGGGMRGIVAGKTLAYLEEALRRKSGNPDTCLADCVDVAIDTGVSGLITQKGVMVCSNNHCMNAHDGILCNTDTLFLVVPQCYFADMHLKRAMMGGRDMTNAFLCSFGQGVDGERSSVMASSMDDGADESIYIEAVGSCVIFWLGVLAESLVTWLEKLKPLLYSYNTFYGRHETSDNESYFWVLAHLTAGEDIIDFGRNNIIVPKLEFFVGIIELASSLMVFEKDDMSCIFQLQGSTHDLWDSG